MWVEKTFRGVQHPKLVELCSSTYKADYRLIPKAEEHEYCRLQEVVKTERILPRTIEFPPLLKELIVRDKLAKGEKISEEPKLSLKYRMGRENHVRVAKEGETPNVQIVSGLGTPVSPSLYKGINV